MRWVGQDREIKQWRQQERKVPRLIGVYHSCLFYQKLFAASNFLNAFNVNEFQLGSYNSAASLPDIESDD
jgi:hypothetical protein